jgi:hypothetical protein
MLPDEMANTMIANIKDKTGKPLQQWIAIAKKSGAAQSSSRLFNPPPKPVSISGSI